MRAYGVSGSLASLPRIRKYEEGEFMKLFQKFNRESWDHTYGSLWFSKLVNCCTGEIQFSTDAIIIVCKKHNVIIPYNTIQSVGKQTYPLTPGYHIVIQDINNRLFFLMVPSPDFYIEKILSFAKSTCFIKQFKSPFMLRLIVYFLPIFLFLSLPLLFIAIFEKTISLNFFALIDSIVFLILAIYFSYLITYERKRIHDLPVIKLLVWNWFVPLVGLMVNAIYFYRYKKTWYKDMGSGGQDLIFDQRYHDLPPWFIKRLK